MCDAYKVERQILLERQNFVAIAAPLCVAIRLCSALACICFLFTHTSISVSVYKEGEKPCPSSASVVILSEDTQDESLLSMFGPVHR